MPNITFEIDSSYNYNFEYKNLINNSIIIERVTILENNYNKKTNAKYYDKSNGLQLQLDTINNMQEHNQSYLTCINKSYQSDLVNVTIPKTRTWRFYLVDCDGNRIKLDHKLIINLIIKVNE